MATGPISSVQTPRAAPAPAPTQQGPVLRSGEQTSSTIEALENPNSRRYLTNVPGSQFIMPDGLALKFLGGVYVTDNPTEIAELDKIANRPGSIITTTVQAKVAEAALQQQAADGAKTDGEGKPLQGGADGQAK